jgi:hypothetical protein
MRTVNVLAASQFSDSAKLSRYDVAFEPSAQLYYSGIVASEYEEPEMEASMKGEQNRLFVWGTVAYDDVFGESWETRFCHHFNFNRAGDDKIARWASSVTHRRTA